MSTNRPEDTTPIDLDPEDIDGAHFNRDKNVDDEDAEGPENLNAGQGHYLDVGPSELRKLQDSVADPKYDGVKRSRKQLHESDEDDANVDDSFEDGYPRMREMHTEWKERPFISSTDEYQDDGRDHDEGGDGESRLSIPNEAVGPVKNQTNFKHAQVDTSRQSPSQDEALTALRRTRTEDKLKGIAVSHQIRIWDALVDARIRLQKSVVGANRLPCPDNIAPYVSTPAGRASAREFLYEALQLSEELFELRHALLSESSSAQPPRKRRRIEVEQNDLDLEALVEESTVEMVALDARTHPENLSTLQKWSAKVQAVSPAAFLQSSRVSFKSGPAHVKSAVEMVVDALREPDKVVRRTWGKAEKEMRIGGEINKGEDNEGDEEAFDDRDFYQAMLRDVIETKGGMDGIHAAELFANIKKQKPKKNVDTRASKGRKLRYEPHEKLQNFMVPIPVRGAWHEEQVDELFASLLGRGFEDNEMSKVASNQGMLGSGALNGFKIFG